MRQGFQAAVLLLYLHCYSAHLERLPIRHPRSAQFPFANTIRLAHDFRGLLCFVNGHDALFSVGGPTSGATVRSGRVHRNPAPVVVNGNYPDEVDPEGGSGFSCREAVVLNGLATLEPNQELHARIYA